MGSHVCPWWGGYFIDNQLRRWLHPPRKILAPHVRPGMTALDFGCGMGLFSLALAELVGPDGRVLSVDLQPQMLAVLNRRAAAAGVQSRITTHTCPADTLALDEPIDFALAFYSAHEVPELGRLLREIHALLRPAGQFLIAEPRGHVPGRDFEAMLALAEPIGLKVAARPHVRLSRAVVLAKT